MWKNTIIGLGIGLGLIGTLALAACSPIDQPQHHASGSADSVPDPVPGVSVSGVTDKSLPTSGYAPQANDNTLVRQSVYDIRVELLQLESFPVQFVLTLTGSLPTPCNQLRVAVPRPDAQGVIAIDVYSVVNPDQICIQVLKEFDVSVPLGSFPTGSYSVWVNGEKVSEFTQ